MFPSDGPLHSPGGGGDFHLVVLPIVLGWRSAVGLSFMVNLLQGKEKIRIMSSPMNLREHASTCMVGFNFANPGKFHETGSMFGCFLYITKALSSLYMLAGVIM